MTERFDSIFKRASHTRLWLNMDFYTAIKSSKVKKCVHCLYHNIYIVSECVSVKVSQVQGLIIMNRTEKKKNGN